MVGFFGATAVLRVTDAGTKQVFDALGKGLAGGLPLGGGKAAFGPVAFFFPLVKNLVDQFGSITRHGFFQCPGGGFGGISQGKNGGLGRLGVWTGIAEGRFVHFGNILFAEAENFSAGAGILLLLQGAPTKTPERPATPVGSGPPTASLARWPYAQTTPAPAWAEAIPRRQIGRRKLPR